VHAGRAVHGDMKGTARTVTHAKKQSIVRSASTAAYVITSDYREVRTTVTACGYQHEAIFGLDTF